MDQPTDQPMDLHYTDAQEAFRAEARAWLDGHAPPPGTLPSLDTAEGFEAHRAWEAELAADRWSVVSWPEEYGGRGVGILEWLVFEEEYWRAQAPLRVSQNGVFLLAPTMFEFGTDGQKARFLPPMASAAEIWCQGWSEPDAGSRPRRHPQPCPSVRRRGRLGAVGTEDVGLPGRLRRLVLRPVPHRSRGRAPPGAHLLPDRHGHPRGDGAPDPPDRRRDRLRRAVLRGRPRARRPGARRRRAGGGTWPWPPPAPNGV